MKLVNINVNEVVFDHNKIEVESCKTMEGIETESYILSFYRINVETKKGLYFMYIWDIVLEEAMSN